MRAFATFHLVGSITAAALLAAACSANDGKVGGRGTSSPAGGAGQEEDTGQGSVEPGTDDPTAGNAGSGAGAGDTIDVGAGGAPIGSACDSKDPNEDVDGDGYSVAQGDCNECDPNTNPGAYDMPGNGIDEDCSGTPDDEVTGCDQGLAIDGNDPMDAARSLGLCRLASAGGWGVVSAKWTGPDGTSGKGINPLVCFAEGGGNMVPAVLPNPFSRGLLPKFGDVVKPRQGGSLLALSSGVAREGIVHFSPMGELMCTTGKTPPGFPKDSPDCPEVKTSNDRTAIDAVALELTIKTPTNAHALSFAFDFYTFEFPDYVCDEYNDFFVALLESKHSATPVDKNISFDSKGGPVSVNNAFVDVCDPAIGALTAKKFPCSRGVAELAGTGFEESADWGSAHAATGWLQTSAPIVPGETITLRFAIWDMKDGSLDSTVLLDDWKWDLDPGAEAKPPETVPAPK